MEGVAWLGYRGAGMKQSQSLHISFMCYKRAVGPTQLLYHILRPG